MIAALHTWGRTLCLHPHVHCLVTGGGWTADGHWKAARNGFLLPVRVVQALFRGKLLAALREGLMRGTLRWPDGVRAQAMANDFHRLGRARWNVYLKERYPHGTGVVTYLGRYLKGGTIANGRLLAAEGEAVTFGYTDHRDGRRKAMTLSAEAFLDRVLKHVPEPGTHGVRTYGLYAARKRALLSYCRAVLGQPPPEPPPVLAWQDTWIGGGGWGPLHRVWPAPDRHPDASPPPSPPRWRPAMPWRPDLDRGTGTPAVPWRGGLGAAAGSPRPRPGGISMRIGGPRSGFVQLHAGPGVGHPHRASFHRAAPHSFFTRCKRAVQLNVSALESTVVG